MITVAVFVDSSDMEAVECSTFQIWYTDRRGDGNMTRVVTSNLLGLH